MERDHRRNIVLIGMPGAGKSTVGVILAKQTSRDFVDTDLLIQTAHQKPLQQILDDRGHMALRHIEEQILLSLSLRNHVIATGGSAAYSSAAMDHLKAHGVAVILHVTLDVLMQRVKDFDTRGIARAPEQTFAYLYQERLALYKKYADITIDCADLDQEKVSAKIRRQLASCEPGRG
jgi:shikimate kinase